LDSVPDFWISSHCAAIRSKT